MIIKKYKVNKLYEIMQQKQVRFSVAVEQGDDVIEVHQPVLCRDFLGDVFTANRENFAYKIYGMEYNPTIDTPVPLDSTKFIIRFPNQVDMANFVGNFPLLVEYEKEHKIKRSSYKELEPLTVLVSGSKFWNQYVFRISFYTFLLRCLTYDIHPTLRKLLENITPHTNEWRYVHNTPKFWEFFNKFHEVKPDKPYKGFGAYDDLKKGMYICEDHINCLHNFSGFVSLCRGEFW